MRVRAYHLGFIAAQLFVALRILSWSPSNRGGGYDLFLVPGARAAWYMRFYLHYPLLSREFDFVSVSVNVVFYALLGLGLGWLVDWTWRRLTQKQQGPRRCRACGYNLTGNVSGVCPECGCATVASERTVKLFKRRRKRMASR